MGHWNKTSSNEATPNNIWLNGLYKRLRVICEKNRIMDILAWLSGVRSTIYFAHWQNKHTINNDGIYNTIEFFDLENVTIVTGETL